MSSSTQSEFYLLTKLEFDVGSQHVKLYGAIQAGTGDAFSFILSNEMQFDPKLLPPGDATTSIPQPFGMTGVELTQFEAQASIYKQDNATQVDFTLRAAATFPKLKGLQLAGALVIARQTPRLALVVLRPDRPLTLTDFVQSVIGGTWSWLDEITNQFAFLSGHMYYLNLPKGEDFTYKYLETVAGKPVEQTLLCTPGYHLAAVLRIFNRYDFAIELGVEPDNTIALSGRYQGEIDFDFIVLKNLHLQVVTGPSKRFSLGTTAAVFGTDFDISADYADSKFTGTVSAEDLSPELSVVFTWTQGSGTNSGFAIVKIDGLPNGIIDALKFVQSLNQMKGGCQQMVSNWFDGQLTTTLKPKLQANNSPRKVGGQMQVPLTLSYEMCFRDIQIARADIDFTALINIPNGLRDLPLKIGTSILDSAVGIAGEMLSNPETYKAVAIAVAKKYGGEALARFICRALEQALEDVAKALAEMAGEVAAETLAAAAELAGALMAVSLLGVKAVLNLLEAAWDEIKSWFTGDKTEKEKAEDKIRDIQRQVEGAVRMVNDKLTTIKATIKNVALRTSLNEQSQFVANLTWNEDIQSTLDAASSLSFNFKMLPGAPGDATGPAIPGTATAHTSFPVVKNWADIPDNSTYQMNAAVQSVLSGFTFMSANTRGTISSAISQLQSFVGDSDAARDFQNYLKARLTEFDGYNTVGIVSDWVYAQSDVPSQTTIGKSRIGINTRITA